MRVIDVALTTNPYKIYVGSKKLGSIGVKAKSAKLGKDAIIITHPVINKLYGKTVADSFKENGFDVKVMEVPEGERSKAAKVAFKLIEEIAAFDVFKQPFIVALGGGVIGDLAGFVAAVYKRGIPYIQVPTTLLAQIDSSIGGKVAVDLPVGKNLVGAFYQPKFVFCDTAVLSTLTKRQIVNGLAEGIKYGIIADAKFFDFMVKNIDAIKELKPQQINHVVLNCAAIKARVVAADEFEKKGLRTILNFGHTVGHAIEAAAKYNRYHHGEAVGLGMRIASLIAEKMGLWTTEDTEKVNRTLDALGLPNTIKQVACAEIVTRMRHDKKFISGKNRFVLPIKIGTVKVVEGVDVKIITSAIKHYLVG